MSEDRNSRIVLLNRLISRSVSKAPQAFTPPTHGAEELFDIINGARKTNSAIEYEGLETKDTEEARHLAGKSLPFVRLSDFRLITRDSNRYAALLIEHGDNTSRALQLINSETFEGRQISGEENEFGASSAHLLVKLPAPDEYEEAIYRTAIEAVAPITRRQIAWFLSAQVRRYAKAQDFHFSVEDPEPGARGRTKRYLYHPKIELVSDIGRQINFAVGGQAVSSIVFAKRGSLKEVSGETTIEYREVQANAEFRISANEGPPDPFERRTWLQNLIRDWKNRGFKSRLYFKALGGKEMVGTVHRDLDGAADLLLCHKERIVFPDHPPRWRPHLCEETVRQLIELVDKDELWQRSGRD